MRTLQTDACKIERFIMIAMIRMSLFNNKTVRREI